MEAPRPTAGKEPSAGEDERINADVLGEIQKLSSTLLDRITPETTLAELGVPQQGLIDLLVELDYYMEERLRKRVVTDGRDFAETALKTTVGMLQQFVREELAARLSGHPRKANKPLKSA